MGKYRITTEGGVYEVTTEDAPSAPSAPEMPPEKQGAFSRFFGSLIDQLNPIPAIKEYINRPGEIAKAADAFHVLSDVHRRAAALPENKGKPMNEWKQPDLTPAERIAVDKGMSANLPGAEGPNPLLAPATTATGQAMKGDLAGAVGTLTGGYVAPAAVGQVAPAIARGAARAAEFTGNFAARDLMQRALKPGAADAPTLADVRQATSTALQHQIPVTEAGAAKLSDLIADYGKKTQAVVDARTRQGATVDPNAVAARLNDVNTTSALPEKATAAVEKARQAFLARKGVAPAGPPTPTGVLDASGQPIMRPGTPANPGNPIPLDVAQAEKQGSYQNAKNSYGELSEAQVEAEKALARGYKEEIEAQAPELKALNAKESEFLGLQPALERAVRNAGNRDIVGLKDLGAGGAGTMAAGPVGGVGLAVTSRVLSMPVIQSRLAIMINKASQRTGTPLSIAASNARAATILSRIAASQQQSSETGAGQ